MVLLISARDSEDCCAKNFERTLFRDPKVVKYTKKYLLPFRFNRDEGIGRNLYHEYSLESKKPSVLVMDWEREILFKTQRCINPGDCLKGMVEALTLTKNRMTYSQRTVKKLKATALLVKNKEYDEALYELKSVKPELLLLSLRKRALGQIRYMEKVAARKLALAKKYEEEKDFEKALSLYKEVSESFRRMNKVKDEASAGLYRVQQLVNRSGSS